MKGYKVRFEQGRGHRMILEGEPPIETGEIDPIQWRMLRSCDVPGLLKLESEELDGSLSLRYSLANRRMLSQTFRIARWTMEDALNALCRLAEVLEQSRDYMLDLDRYILEDDYIFAGQGPHDLAFVYLPLWRRTASASLSSDIERLIVRWMMNVEAPDGAIMQQLLRLASSPDFSPALLRRYIRQTLAGAAGLGGLGSSAELPGETPVRKPNPAGIRNPYLRERDRSSDIPPTEFTPAKKSTGRSMPALESQRPLGEPGGEKSKAGGSTERERRAVGPKSWPPTDPQGLSGLLGEPSPGWSESAGSVNDAEPANGNGRSRIWTLGLTAVLVASVWRFVYLPHPSGRGMLIASGLTIILAAVCCWLLTRQRSAGSIRPEEREEPECLEEEAGFEPFDDREQEEFDEPVQRGGARLSFPQESRSPRFGMAAERKETPENRQRNDEGEVRPAGAQGSAMDYAIVAEHAADIEPLKDPQEAMTAWLPSHEDGTALLGEEYGETRARRQQPYLEWDREGVRVRIKLPSEGLVIGRSREAAQHIDDTDGISRAHLELALGDDAWQARDLGSRNGSWLNGVPMAPYEAYPLSKGDSIQVASSLYRFKNEE